jgi:hypothetical protein
MNVASSAGLAPAWTAAKPAPADHTAQLAAAKQQPTAGETPASSAGESPPAARQAPAPEGQGTRVDIRV